VTQVLKVDLSRLAPYDNYQMEFCPALGTPWGVLPASYIPTGTTNTLYIMINGAAGFGDIGFFRAKHLP
jgi:hypothetical protein